MTRPRRSGFTLFQLLLLLAVLLILLGLLLPAVQKVRQAAARTQSANNLKQIGLACHNYAGTFNSDLPSGVDSKHFSALFHLLPYIEQQNLYNLADRTKTVDAMENARVREAIVKTFLSPLDPILQTNPKWGGTNYMAMAGSKASLEDNDGVLYKDSVVKISNIPDGTSNTLLFVETLRGDGGKKAVSVTRQHVRLDKKALKDIKDEAGVKDFQTDKHIAGDRGASWMDGRFLQATMNGTRKANDSRPDVDCGGEGGLSAPRTLWQAFNVAMCDGSVRAVSVSISHVTWKAASTRNGGEVLGADW
jgi:prepilin-type processing-associated H-X9-DG protein